MVTQPFTAAVRQFPTTDRDPSAPSREQFAMLLQEIDAQSIILGELREGIWAVFNKLDTDAEMGALVVTGTVGHNTTSFGDGVTTVTAAGTDVVLAASTAAKWVMIQAQTDNTSKIAVGAFGVDATVATGDGILLDPGDVVTIPCDNLADIFIDALVTGEGVRYAYGT